MNCILGTAGNQKKNRQAGQAGDQKGRHETGNAGTGMNCMLGSAED
jgi:hypothetical protein